MEVTLISIENKKFVNRGFLIGPYCPIYGCGAVFITLVLGKYQYDPLVLFVMTTAACGILEYLTSWAMEILFKARWWDYSKDKWNINGRICLRNLVAFGVLGLAIIYLFNPIFIGWIENLNESTLKWISGIIAIIWAIDSVISFIVIFGFRKVTKAVNQERKEDNTEQITDMVRNILTQKSFFHRRFINAYPKLIAIKTKIKEITEKITENVSDVKDTITVKKDEIKDNIEKSTRSTKAKIYLSKKKIKSKFKGDKGC
ncbi:MAG: hypothetical protein HFJ17_00430 [Clostridia bacterium]|nr:hypothetical protein [Clostridia bacterium]